MHKEAAVCKARVGLQRGQVQVQHGVLRTNCIDCLDRTNVAQFAYGLAAMGQQLHGLGLADSPTIDAQSSAARELMDMYEAMGNVLSRQVCCIFFLHVAVYKSLFCGPYESTLQS